MEKANNLVVKTYQTDKKARLQGTNNYGSNQQIRKDGNRKEIHKNNHDANSLVNKTPIQIHIKSKSKGSIDDNATTADKSELTKDKTSEEKLKSNEKIEVQEDKSSFENASIIRDVSNQTSKITSLDINKNLEGPLLTRALVIAIPRNKNEIKPSDGSQKSEFTSNIRCEDEEVAEKKKNISRELSELGSRNTSQVFRIENYERIMAESPGKSPTKSRLPQWEESESPSSHKTSLNIEETNTFLFSRSGGSLSYRHSAAAPMSPQKNWRRISNVIKSVTFLKQEKVKIIEDADEIFDEMEQYKPRKVRNLHAEGTNKDLANDNFVQFALDSIRRTEILCECATVGSDSHLKLMEKILKEDPRKNILSRNDENHIINKRGRLGQNSLYLAAKFGNLKIVKFLLEEQANPNIQSNIDRKELYKEKCLHVAARWGYRDVVSYLLDHVEFDRADIKKAIKTCNKQDLKKFMTYEVMSKNKFRNVSAKAN